jgi:hypothetical protein
VTTFICRGLLNPPGGADDGLSMGVLSRHVEDSESLTLTLSGVSTQPENLVGDLFEIGIVAVSSHTDVEIELTVPRTVNPAGGTIFDPAADIDAAEDAEILLEARNPGWTVVIGFSGSPSHWDVVFTRAALSAGSHTLYIDDDDGHGIFAWSWGEASDTDTYEVVVAGFSNEVTATGDTVSGIEIGDLELSGAWDPDPVIEDDPVELTVTATNRAFATDDLSVTIQITDAVTCSSPTTASNPGSWSIGSWTSPGGGVQWQCLITKTSVAEDASASVVFETTPSEGGTLVANLSGVFSVAPFGEAAVASVEVIPITWAIDATSDIAAPADSTEWGDIIAAYSLAASAPSNLWLMQEASGNLADSIGSVTLATSFTVSYQNAITGWTRDGLGTTDATNGRWLVSSGTGPNPSSTSVAALLYVRIDSTGGDRPMIVFNSAVNDWVLVNVLADGTIRGYCDANSNGGSVNYEGGSVIPVIVSYDRTNSRFHVYTDQEKITVTYGAVGTDGSKGFGGIGSFPATAMYLYGCWWSGANAEILSTDANAKALLQALGWTVTGY